MTIQSTLMDLEKFLFNQIFLLLVLESVLQLKLPNKLLKLLLKKFVNSPKSWKKIILEVTILRLNRFQFIHNMNILMEKVNLLVKLPSKALALQFEASIKMEEILVKLLIKLLLLMAFNSMDLDLIRKTKQKLKNKPENLLSKMLKRKLINMLY